MSIKFLSTLFSLALCILIIACIVVCYRKLILNKITSRKNRSSEQQPRELNITHVNFPTSVGAHPIVNQPILSNRVDQSNICINDPVVSITPQISDPNGLPPSYDDVIRSNLPK